MKKKNVGTIVAILVLLAVFVFTVYLNREQPIFSWMFSSSDDEVSGFDEIPLEAADKYTFKRNGNNIISANSAGVVSYSDSLVSQWSVNASGNNPVIKTNGEYCLIYYMDSVNAILVNGKKSTPIVTEENIILGSINENGYYALVTSEKGYKAQVSVYSPDGSVIYKWHSANNYILDVDISLDNKNMTVAATDFEKSTASSSIMFFNFSQEKPYGGKSVENSFVFDVKYTKNDNIVAISDSAIIGYNSMGEQKFLESFEGRTIRTFNFDSNNNIIVALEGNDGALIGSTVRIYNSHGNLKGEYKCDEKVSSLDIYDNEILVVYPRGVSLISSSGNVIKSMELNMDIKTAIYLKEKNSIFLVSGSSAKIINIK